ncbi:hypothetical protein BDD12DRAFT_873735 [Trichophaea hybrida]|nr:hypothetical protein BDD12DRAFT_873735 [Trichophaea hybrida]
MSVRRKLTIEEANFSAGNFGATQVPSITKMATSVVSSGDWPVPCSGNATMVLLFIIIIIIVFSLIRIKHRDCFSSPFAAPVAIPLTAEALGDVVNHYKGGDFGGNEWTEMAKLRPPDPLPINGNCTAVPPSRKSTEPEITREPWSPKSWPLSSVLMRPNQRDCFSAPRSTSSVPLTIKALGDVVNHYLWRLRGPPRSPRTGT